MKKNTIIGAKENLLYDCIFHIRNLKLLDNNIKDNIQKLSHSDKYEIILAYNDIVESLVYVLNLSND